jgi:hypothetical protein
LAAAAGLDLRGFLRARPEAILRRQTEGDRGCVLVDLFREEGLGPHVWLRFRLDRGAGEGLEHVTRDGQEVRSVLGEEAGQDLWVIVQLPRVDLSREIRLSLKFAAIPGFEFELPRIR